MASNADILKKAGEAFVGKLKSEFDVKGLNDTNAARDSISFKSDNTKLEIEGLLRVVVMQTGRKPGSFPPLDPIKNWVRRKLSVDESEVDGVAFAIAKKIQKKGTDILTDRSKGLQIELLIEELNSDLFGEISTQAAFSITETVLEAYK